ADPEIIDRRRGLVATANLELIFPHLRRANIDERNVYRSRGLVETLGDIDRAQGSAQAAGAEWINRWRGRAHEMKIKNRRSAGAYRHTNCFSRELNGILFGGKVWRGGARPGPAWPGLARLGKAGINQRPLGREANHEGFVPIERTCWACASVTIALTTSIGPPSLKVLPLSK